MSWCKLILTLSPDQTRGYKINNGSPCGTEAASQVEFLLLAEDNRKGCMSLLSRKGQYYYCKLRNVVQNDFQNSLLPNLLWKYLLWKLLTTGNITCNDGFHEIKRIWGSKNSHLLHRLWGWCPKISPSNSKGLSISSPVCFSTPRYQLGDVTLFVSSGWHIWQVNDQARHGFSLLLHFPHCSFLSLNFCVEEIFLCFPIFTSEMKNVNPFVLAFY